MSSLVVLSNFIKLVVKRMSNFCPSRNEKSPTALKLGDYQISDMIDFGSMYVRGDGLSNGLWNFVTITLRKVLDP